MTTNELTTEERAAVWKQIVEARDKAQETYDSSIRTLAAAGIAVTVSVATALGSMPLSGKLAVTAFVASLIANLASYVTEQLDYQARLSALRTSAAYEAAEGRRWMTITTWLNAIAGVLFVLAAALLAVFVGANA